LSPSISRALSGFGWRSAFIAFVLLFAFPASAQSLSPGAGTIELPIGPNKQPMTVWYYRPAGLSAEDRVLFVLHGVRRNADVYRDSWIPHAQRHRFLLLVPEFSRALFPTTESYNLGNVITKDGTKDGAENPREVWSFAVIDRAFEQVVPLTPIRRKTYALFGHSAGAQFVHRFMTLWPADPVEAAIAANAGAYLLPLASEPFPYGLQGLALSETALKASFARPLILLLGEADTDPNHPFLPRAPAAQRQGDFRLARGKHYFETAKAEAARLGTPFAWKLATVPGVAHEEAKMAEAAAQLLFRKSAGEE